MTALCKTGSFSTGTGAATTTVAVTDVGFTPKFVILWWNGRTDTVDAVGSATHRRGVGVTAGSSGQWVCSQQSTDAGTAAATDSNMRTDSCITTLSTAGAVDGRYSWQSFESTGFTLLVDDAMPSDMRVHYMAFGGTDITNVATGVAAEPAATGDVDNTTPGFQPDFAFFAQASIGTTNPTGAGGVAVDSRMFVGAAAGATPTNYVWSGGSNDAATTMQTGSYCKSGECIATTIAAVTGYDGRASLTAWLSNGYRLNWVERAATRYHGYLVVKGGRWIVGDLLTQTDTTTDIVESGFGFSPLGAMFLSHGKAQSTTDTLQDHDEWSMGAFSDASTERAMATHDEDNTADAEVATAVEHDNVYVKLTTSDTVESAMQVISVGSDGFTCEMTDAGAAQNFVWYFAFGAKVSMPIPRSPMIHYAMR